MTEAGRSITAADVDIAFRESFKLGPWPDREKWHPVAMRLEQYRKAPLPKVLPKVINNATPAARKLLQALPEREKYWKKMLGEPGTEMYDRVRENPDAAKYFYMTANASAAFAMLRAALNLAMPFIDMPPAAARSRIRTPWHAAARLVASQCLAVWRAAGGTEISVEEDGPLVDFVVWSLDRMGVEAGPGAGAPTHAAVATALRRSKLIRWLRNHEGFDPPS